MDRNGNGFVRDEKGGMTVEAAIVFPFFLTFIIALQAVFQIAAAQMALRSSVSETVKQVSGRLYPVQLLYREARERVQQTRTAALIGDVLDRIQEAGNRLEQVEDGADQAASFIPEPVLELVRWEKQKREQVEQMGAEQFEQVKEATFDKAVNQAFTGLVYHYADKRRLTRERFRVTHVTFPDWDDRTKAYFGVEAAYELQLSLPFYRKTLLLKESAMEKAWLDAF